MFDISLLDGTITVFYVKMLISTFITYVTLLTGLYFNYRATMRRADQQAEALKLTQAQHDAYMRDARLQFIRDTAKTQYFNVKKIAEKTESKIDDKLLLYVERFYDAMLVTFGSPPTEAEKQYIIEKATETHEELKAYKSVSITPPPDEEGNE